MMHGGMWGNKLAPTIGKWEKWPTSNAINLLKSEKLTTVGKIHFQIWRINEFTAREGSFIILEREERPCILI